MKPTASCPFLGVKICTWKLNLDLFNNKDFCCFLTNAAILSIEFVNFL